MSRYISKLIPVILLIAILLSACAQPAATTAEPKPTEATQPTQAAKPTEAVTQPTEAPIPTKEPMSEGMLPEVDPSAQSGNIIIAGSSTVFPLAERMAERFKDEGFTDDKGQITYDSIGSGGGMERFCKTGETDIAGASRGIKDEEIANCQAIGRTPIEFRVGTDALAVVVSKENTFLTNVTTEQLAQIFSTAEMWSDVDPSWPAEPILRFSPGTDSGTFDF
ncbi:MAG: substrate-binding domain-containing protein, partial [Anaerolineales bacterium]|nr:substrate-binding domain-containing protein [Anaerolineales bacterium]